MGLYLNLFGRSIMGKYKCPECDSKEFFFTRELVITIDEKGREIGNDYGETWDSVYCSNCNEEVIYIKETDND